VKSRAEFIIITLQISINKLNKITSFKLSIADFHCHPKHIRTDKLHIITTTTPVKPPFVRDYPDKTIQERGPSSG